MMRYEWRIGTPPVNVIVEVWFGVSVILAMWTGSTWRTIEGDTLADVTHWRPR